MLLTHYDCVKQCLANMLDYTDGRGRKWGDMPLREVIRWPEMTMTLVRAFEMHQRKVSHDR